MKFTAANVLKIRPPEGIADYVEWDEATPGFGIRFRDGGKGTYFIKFFVNGKQGKMSLGKVGLDFEEVKRNAVQKLGMVKLDQKNPIVERAKQETAAEDLFPARIPAFLSELETGKPGRPPRCAAYIKDIKRSLNVRLKELHRYSLAEIKRSAVVNELDDLEAEYGFRSAGSTRAHLSSYYRFCMRKGYDGASPVDGTENRYSQARERFHTPHELLLIWRATEEPTRYNRIVRLLMLTGMRKTIFGRLRHSEVNAAEHCVDVCIEDAGKAKNGQEFLLPMSRQVEAMVLDAMKTETGSEFVFSGTAMNQKRGFNDWSNAKEALDARVTALNDGQEIPHWVLHDFRRTFRTLGGDICKIPDNITDVCIYHVGEAKKGLNGVYNKRTYLDEKRDAMQRWADFVDQLVHGKREFKVISA